ncbi:hypothetical protein BC830DRAFT_1172194, partial [Chytriomyces sp. MP71]
MRILTTARLSRPVLARPSLLAAPSAATWWLGALQAQTYSSRGGRRPPHSRVPGQRSSSSNTVTIDIGDAESKLLMERMAEAAAIAEQASLEAGVVKTDAANGRKSTGGTGNGRASSGSGAGSEGGSSNSGGGGG